MFIPIHGNVRKQSPESLAFGGKVDLGFSTRLKAKLPLGDPLAIIIKIDDIWQQPVGCIRVHSNDRMVKVKDTAHIRRIGLSILAQNLAVVEQLRQTHCRFPVEKEINEILPARRPIIHISISVHKDIIKVTLDLLWTIL